MNKSSAGPSHFELNALIDLLVVCRAQSGATQLQHKVAVSCLPILLLLLLLQEQRETKRLNYF